MTSPDATESDVALRADDGTRLHARHWGVPSPRGVVVVAHGLGEHGGCYRHVAGAVGPAASVDFVAPDLRGHGHSAGRRGVVLRYDELTSDLFAAFDWAGREWPGLPRFVLGHSNGGQVAFRAALDPRGQERIAGLIFSNPSLRLAVRVPAYKLRLGRFLRRRAPWVTLSAPLETVKLSRDPEMRRNREADRLCHCRISPHLFFGMVEGGESIIARVGEVRSPVLMIVGEADPIVDPFSCREAFDGLGSSDKTLRVYPGMLHEPFNELGREEVLRDLAAWLTGHITGASMS